MPEARLEIVDTLGRRVVPLERAAVTIGRRNECAVRIVGTDISRDHAEIVWQVDHYVVRDRGSRYGTFVNNEAVTERALVHGDRIRLGRSDAAEMRFLIDEESKSAVLSPVDTVHQMAVLLQGLRALGSGHVLDDVLALVLDATIELTGADRAFIMLATADQRLKFTRGRARGAVDLSGGIFETSLKIPESVFRTGEIRVETDLLNAGDTHNGTVAMGIRYVLCAPLRLVQFVHEPGVPPEQKQIGVLYLDARQKGRLLSQTTRTAVETLAIEAAVVIENARLYRETLEKARTDQELSIAAEIQRALLPEPRLVGPGFEIVGASFPCRSIGGDFFEYLWLPSGDFGFGLGDVAGKGPPAALLTAAAQGIFAALATSEGGPAATIGKLNQALIRRSIGNRFVTMVYGVLSPSGRLIYCNAGHNPAMLFTRDGVRRLETGGLLLGLFPRAEYQEEELRLEQGDLLVMFSDGVSEAINTLADEFGDNRIISCVDASRQLPPPELLERLLVAVRQFSEGTLQRDDITVLVLRYTGHS